MGGWHYYSITSSAIASRPGGKLRPNALAVLRLITRWSAGTVEIYTYDDERHVPIELIARRFLQAELGLALLI